MRRPDQKQTGTQILSTLALFCYSTSLIAMLALGYALIALVLSGAEPQIGSMYSASGM
jgi:hypothetical protein